MAPEAFKRRYRQLILMTWALPPVVGVSFLVFIGVLTPAEVRAILAAPTQGGYILLLVVVAAAFLYFERFARPITAYLEAPEGRHGAAALVRMRRFPLDFWTLFAAYVLSGPAVLTFTIHHYLGHALLPLSGFRIQLVALIVSILVGLPIFLRTLDLFGRALGGLKLARPHFTLRTKIFLMGTLTPLLIDTVLVQYYWARTGYFTAETFVVWFALELIAIAGSLIFVAGFGQSLSPLQQIIARSAPDNIRLDALQPRSTDELGVLAGQYQDLLQERFESEARTQRSERELGGILANMQDTYYRTDAQGVLVRVSAAARNLLGYEPEELVGTRLADLYAETDGRERFLVELAANGGVLRNRETHLRHRDGTDIWVSTNAQYYRGADGRMAGVEGTTRDITDLKMAQRALYQEKERALVTLQSIGDGVVTTDPGGRIDYLNPIAEQLIGMPAKECLGRHHLDILKLRDTASGEPLEDLVRLCLSRDGSRVHADDGVLRRGDGTEFSIKVTAAPMRDRGGQNLGVVLVLHDITEVMGMARQLNYQASHDALTGLVNRREFERRLELALRETRAGGGPHALLYMDLDQFKLVNDTCGHPAGDELLRQLSALLLHRIRERDVLARLGGDEFGVLLENCSLERAQVIAEELRRVVREFRFVWQEKSFDIGVSIGMVPLAGDSLNLADVLSAADTACYVAKDNGRNRIQVYRPDDDSAVRRHHGEMEWVHRISQAFDEGRFRLYCQPIRALNASAAGQSPHYEVLVRMADGEGGIIAPMAFIPAAERYNLMPTLDRWVVRTTFEKLRELQGEAARPPVTCAVNLSGQSLCDDHILDFVVEQFEASGIPYDAVCFEVTETAAITNLTRAMQFIGHFKARGCTFALDDFGSGLSSFAYLKNLPVDFLKIDGSFVKDMADDPIDRAMVSAINQVGQVMGIRTIAEFVENDAIMQELQRMGVDYAQGYGVGRPVPIDTLFSNDDDEEAARA